jgi:hypothetical protein
MNALEAIADGIMAFEGWKPGSRSYRNRNPGNLEGGHGRATGVAGPYNVYDSFLDGYSDLLDELKAKFSGNNRHGIGPTSTFLELMNVYAPPSDNNPTTAYAAFVMNWASRALGRNVDPSTTLESIWQADIS